METSNYKKVNVWQKTNEVAPALYESTQRIQKKDNYLANRLADCCIALSSKVALAGDLWSMEKKITYLESANEEIYNAISLLNLLQRLGYYQEEVVQELENQLVEISHALLSWIKNCNRKLNDNPPAEQPVTEE